MRSEDLIAVSMFLKHVSIEPQSCVLLSGQVDEAEVIHERWNHITKMDTFMRDAFDLNLDVPPPHDADLVVAFNTFMCSTDPLSWLQRLSRDFRWLLIQDISIGSRHSYRHLAPETGDHTRYSATKHEMVGVTDPGHECFDLDSTPYPIVELMKYTIDDGRGVKFAAVIDLQPDPIPSIEGK